MRLRKEMNNYIDKYGRYHDKPVNASGDPSSNNGFIYSAYAAKLGLTLSKGLIHQCFDYCLNFAKKFYFRSPGKALPPISRDEVLGAAALGFLFPRHLNGWNFSPFPLPKFNLFTLVKQLWQLRPTWEMQYIDGKFKTVSAFKHRNYFWQNNLDQLYRFAFSVPLTDRHFLLSQWGRFTWYNPMHLLYWTIAKIDSKLGKSNGIRWLKYGKGVEEMTSEFPADHPIVIATSTRNAIEKVQKEEA
jgi:hypothetical protein